MALDRRVVFAWLVPLAMVVLSAATVRGHGTSTWLYTGWSGLAILGAATALAWRGRLAGALAYAGATFACGAVAAGLLREVLGRDWHADELWSMYGWGFPWFAAGFALATVARRLRASGLEPTSWRVAVILLFATTLAAGSYDILRTAAGGRWGLVEAGLLLAVAALAAGACMPLAHAPRPLLVVVWAYVAGALVGLVAAFIVDDATRHRADLEILGVAILLYPAGLVAVPLLAWLASVIHRGLAPRATPT